MSSQDLLIARCKTLYRKFGCETLYCKFDRDLPGGCAVEILARERDCVAFPLRKWTEGNLGSHWTNGDVSSKWKGDNFKVKWTAPRTLEPLYPGCRRNCGRTCKDDNWSAE